MFLTLELKTKLNSMSIHQIQAPHSSSLILSLKNDHKDTAFAKLNSGFTLNF